MSNSGKYDQGKTFPVSAQGVGGFLLFIVGLWIYYHGWESITNPYIIILIYAFIWLFFSRTTIWVKQNKWIRYWGIFPLRFKKSIDLKKYKIVVLEETLQRYQVKHGGGIGFEWNTPEFSEKFHGLYLRSKDKQDGTLLFKGKVNEIKAFAQKNLKPFQYKVYRGVLKKERELKY